MCKIIEYFSEANMKLCRTEKLDHSYTVNILLVSNFSKICQVYKILIFVRFCKCTTDLIEYDEPAINSKKLHNLW